MSLQTVFGACIAALVINACGSAQPPPAAPPATSPPTTNLAVAGAPATAPAALPVAPAPATTAAVAPAPQDKHEHKFHHPAIGMLMVEVASVGLRPDQQATVDAIKAELEKQTDATKAQRGQLTSDIADGVAKGKLDKTKIDTDTKKLAQAADATTKSVQDAMNKLHQTLDPEQRRKLVTLMQAKAEEMREHGMGEPGKGPHAEPGKGPHGEHGEHGMGPHASIEKLGELLGLTPDQREKLKAKLEATMKSRMATMKDHHGAMQKRMKAVSEAFVTDKFDAKRAGVGEKFGEMVQLMTKGRIEFVDAVLSILTPDQRSKFAEHVRQHGEMGDG